MNPFITLFFILKPDTVAAAVVSTHNDTGCMTQRYSDMDHIHTPLAWIPSLIVVIVINYNPVLFIFFV